MNARDDYPLNMNDPLNRRVLAEIDRLRVEVADLRRKRKHTAALCGEAAEEIARLRVELERADPSQSAAYIRMIREEDHRRDRGDA